MIRYITCCCVIVALLGIFPRLVDVHIPPHIKILPHAPILYERVILVCVTYGNPEPTIRGWLHNGVPLREGNGVSLGLGARSVEIAHLRKQDQGNYECVTSIQVKDYHLNGSVFLEGLQRNLTYTTNSTSEGWNVTLTCPGEFGLVKWDHTGDRNIGQDSRFSTKDGRCELHIANAQLTDEGMFICEAFNNAKGWEAICRVFLNVTPNAVKPNSSRYETVSPSSLLTSGSPSNSQASHSRVSVTPATDSVSTSPDPNSDSGGKPSLQPSLTPTVATGHTNVTPENANNGFQPLGVVLPVTIVIVLVVAVITVFVIARHVKRRRNRQESCESRSTRQRTSSDEMSTCMNTLNGDIDVEELIKAVVEHGSDRWYEIGRKLDMSASGINCLAGDKPSYSSKLRAIIDRKRQQLGDKELGTKLLEACFKVDVVVGKAVQQELLEKKLLSNTI